MKILFVLPYVPSPIRVRPYHFVRELARRHDVTVLATETARNAGDAEKLREFCRSVEVVPLRPMASLRSCARAALRGDPLQAAVCHSPELDHRLAEVLSRDTFDIVHVEHLRAARLHARIPRGVPTLYDAVDCISLLLERTLRSSHSPRQRALALLELHRTRVFEGRVLERFDRAIVTSPEDAGVLGTLAPGARLAVVPNGVDMERFRPLGRPRETATLVLSGKMSYHANVTAALHFVRDIFPHIRRARPEVRLCIVGSNPPEAVRELARDPAIVVTGHVPDLHEFLGRATVSVCPVTVKVGIQNKVLESMATGVPVVSSKAGAQGLEAEPGKDFLVADGPVQFAEHVCRLLGDQELANRVGRAGRRYVEDHHRWDAAVGRLEDLYREALDHRSYTLGATGNGRWQGAMG